MVLKYYFGKSESHQNQQHPSQSVGNEMNSNCSLILKVQYIIYLHVGTNFWSSGSNA